MVKLSGKLLSIVFLSAISIGSVFADSRNQDEDRDRARAERQIDARRNNERNIDNRQYVDPRQQGHSDNQRQNQDNGRRNGRMTPEEKQALRRQINEAGQDIYAPRR